MNKNEKNRKKKTKNIGLALGGGGVLGAAHIGALRAMEEQEIEIEYISGTSIGAFVAVFYAFGNKADKIEEIVSELKWLDISRVSLSRYGLLSIERLGDLIIEHLGNRNIEDAQIPLTIVATDIFTGEKVVFDKGSVADAVMASMSVPGIFQPLEINGKMLVDGGIAENVPVNTVKGMGAGYIIGIDLNAKHTYENPDNIIEVIMNSLHFLIKVSDKLQTEDADLLIKPDLSKFNRSDIEHVSELMTKGYQETRKILSEISHVMQEHNEI